MSLRRYNVIIPTRERADTFEWCLKTCLNQDYDDLRIIISDNCSGDHTQDIVNAAKDSRISYFNTGERLSMSDNWEYALDKVKDGHLLFLGDDDGLLPDIFPDVNNIFDMHDLPVLTWKCDTYYWPNYLDDQDRDKLTLHYTKGVEIRDSKKELHDVLNFKNPWGHLPFLYGYGIVDSAILKKGKNKRFFNSSIPDVYSSIVLSHLTEKFIHSRAPFSIAGASGHSTGSFQSSKKKTVGGSSDPKNKFARENNIPFHPSTPYVHTAPVLVAESYFQAKDQYDDFDYPLSIPLLIESSLQKIASFDHEKYGEAVKMVKDLADLHRESSFFERIKSKYPQRSLKARKPRVFGFHITGTGAILDGSEYHIKNIYDASLLSHATRKIVSENKLGVGKKLINAFQTVLKRWVVKKNRIE